MLRHPAVRIPLSLGYGLVALLVSVIAVLAAFAALGLLPMRGSIPFGERLGLVLLAPCFALWGAVWGGGAWRLARPGPRARWLRPAAWALMVVEALQWLVAALLPQLNPQDAAAISLFVIGGTALLLAMLGLWRRAPAPVGAI